MPSEDRRAREHSARVRLWVCLLMAGTAGIVASIPLDLQVQRLDATSTGGQIVGNVIAHAIQYAILIGFFSWIGVALSPLVGLDAPLLRLLAERKSIGKYPSRSVMVESIALGTATAVFLLGATGILESYLARGLSPHPKIFGWWTGLTSSVSASIIEELLTRWGTLTGLAFVLTKLGFSRGSSFWVANGLAALLFGAAHLPNLRLLGDLGASPLALETFVVASNGIAGIAFGYLYRRRGIEASILAHATTDVWLHAVVPSLAILG